MTLEPLSGDLRAFAEDPGAFVAIGPDEERILTDRYSVTFTPGKHYWSASVQRLRFGVDDIAGGVAEIRGLVADRGRTAAAWTVGPSATPNGLLELLLATGMKSESDEGSLILVLTEPPHIQASPFEVRLVSSYEDHVAAVEVANQGFAFPSVDARDERRRARASFRSERAGGHSVRLLAVDGGRPVAAGRAWFRRWACTWVAGRRSRRSVGGAPWVPWSPGPGRRPSTVGRQRWSPGVGRWPRRACSVSAFVRWVGCGTWSIGSTAELALDQDPGSVDIYRADSAATPSRRPRPFNEKTKRAPATTYRFVATLTYKPGAGSLRQQRSSSSIDAGSRRALLMRRSLRYDRSSPIPTNSPEPGRTRGRQRTCHRGTGGRYESRH
jgi:hypothetical protein